MRRSAVHTRVRFCQAVGTIMCLALMLAAPALAHKRTATVHAHAVAGKLWPVRATARKSRFSSAFSSVSPSASSNRGARRIPRSSSTSARALIAAPHASASPLTTAPTSLLANFNGVSSRDSGVTNFGQEFEPPDQGLCAGNGFVVEMVNSAYTVYKPNGTVVTGPFNVNGPFDEGLTEFTSDPRCQYDAANHTFFASILFISADNTSSHEDLAVNSSGDPTTPWTTYRIDTTDNGGKTGPKHPGCPCFGDQPLLGIDATNVYISTNEFSILGPQFNGAQIYAIAKSDLIKPKPAPPSTPAHFVHFDKLSIGGAPAASIQPAITTGTPPAEFFLNALDPNGTFDQRIGVWAMTNRGVVATGGKPTLSSVVINSEAYGIPPQAEQKGSTSLIDSGDDRMQQVQAIGGDVWGALDSSVTIPNDPAARAGAAWFDVRPTLSNGVISAATTLHRQGYVVLAGKYLLYPAITAAPSGQVAMVMTLTGAQNFPSAAYATLATGGTSFGAITVAAAGATHYDPAATRWGDYSWAVLDPSGKSIWMATEYIPPKASQTADGLRDWGTRVLNLATP
jgi:hypothetical protein